MKRLALLFFAFFSLVLVSQKSQAQVFEKGDWSIDLGVGYADNKTNRSITFSNYYYGVRTETEAKKQGSVMLSVGVEYRLFDKIGLALEGQLATTGPSYYVSEAIGHQDLKLKFNYHLFNSNINDLFFGIAFGMSHLKWEKSSTSWAYGGSGTSPLVELSISDRLFVRDKRAISINIFYTKYWYDQLKPYSVHYPDISNFTFNMSSIGVQLSYVFEGKG